MNPSEAAAIYSGQVVHARLRPKRHKLKYQVFSLLVDLDRLPELGGDFRLFSHNRFNMFSFHDRDHGPGDGRPLGPHFRDLLTRTGLSAFGARILLLGYPRMFGYVFNPLSVYFCYDHANRLGAIAYEVNNTFHERKTYLVVVPDAGEREPIHQDCAKSFHVSPFNAGKGRYSFHIMPPGEAVAVGVALRDEAEPLMRAHFAGKREAFGDRALARLALRYPLMTLKVIGGIHLEAFRLWRKGVPLVRRVKAPGYSVDFVAKAGKEAEPILMDNV